MIDGNEIWEALFSIMEGDVPDEMTEGICQQLADHLNALAALTTPASDAAPVALSPVIVRTGPCQHRWSHAPTVGYYLCVECGERHDHGTPIYEQLKAALAHPPHPAPVDPVAGGEGHGVMCATVRDGGDFEWHIECRFADGQKFAAIRVDKDHEALADWIAAALKGPAA